MYITECTRRVKSGNVCKTIFRILFRLSAFVLPKPRFVFNENDNISRYNYAEHQLKKYWDANSLVS